MAGECFVIPIFELMRMKDQMLHFRQAEANLCQKLEAVHVGRTTVEDYRNSGVTLILEKWQRLIQVVSGQNSGPRSLDRSNKVAVFSGLLAHQDNFVGHLHSEERFQLASLPPVRSSA